MTVSHAAAGTLTTLDGKTYDGDIRLDTDALMVMPKSGAPVRVELSNVLSATFSTADRPLLRGVMLTDGEAFAADAITRLDDAGVRFVRHGGVAGSVPMDSLARVIFRPVPPEVLHRVPSGHGGVILDSGDFFEGDLAGFDGNTVKISSVLFGIQSFDTNKQALAVILHGAPPAVPATAEYIVRLMDGAVLLGKRISISDSLLTVDDNRLGAVQVSGKELMELRIAGGAFASLTAILPSNLNENTAADSYTIDGTTVGVPMTLVGLSPAHGIGQRPALPLTWDLGGKYKSFTARAGVPLALVPMRHLQFVVLADGKEVFRSPPRCSIDDPVAVGVDLTNVQTISLRIDGADSTTLGAEGVWADPILVKTKKSN